MISIFDRSARTLIARLGKGLPVPIPSPSPNDGLRGWIHASDASDTGRMIVLTAGATQSLNRDYTVGSPNPPMTHRDYVSRLANVVGVEPNLAMIPRDFLDNDPSVPADCLYREQTRFDLWHSIERFLGDFPGFQPATNLDACFGDYVEAMNQDRLAPDEQGIEGKVVDVWLRQSGKV